MNYFSNSFDKSQRQGQYIKSNKYTTYLIFSGEECNLFFNGNSYNIDYTNS